MNTSPRVRPISSSSVSSSRPAWPTNGRPWRSSLAPGASPTNIRSASALPEPKTTVWRVEASCGHLVQLLRLLPDGLELLAPLRCGPHRLVDSNRPHGGLSSGSTPEAGISVRELDSIAIVGAGRLGTALAAALGAPSPLGRGADARGATAVLLCVPDARDRRRGRRRRRRARSSATAPARPGSTCCAPHEAFSLHPLMTVPAGAPPDVLDGAGCAVDGSTPRALAAGRGAGGAARHARHAGDRRGSRRLPRRRLDRLELPRHARGRRRAPRRHRRRRARAAGAARARRGRELGRARRRGGADRPDRPRRRRDRGAPAGRGRRAHARPPAAVRRAWSTRRGRWWRREDHPHQRGDARPPRAGSRHRRPRPDHGRLPRRPPRADARRPRALRRGRRLAVRQPRPVQRARGPRRLSARRGARRRRGGRARRRRAVRPAGRGGVPARLRHQRPRRRALGRPRGRRSAAPATSPASARS